MKKDDICILGNKEYKLIKIIETDGYYKCRVLYYKYRNKLLKKPRIQYLTIGHFVEGHNNWINSDEFRRHIDEALEKHNNALNNITMGFVGQTVNQVGAYRNY